MSLSLRRRDILLIISLWALACVGILTLVLLFLSWKPVGGSISALPGNAATPIPMAYQIDNEEMTALNQYPRAEEAARNWAADAQLVAVNAGWSYVLMLEQIGTPTRWSYHFYSPEQKRLLFVVIEPEGEIHTVKHALKTTLPPQPIMIEKWQVDSPQALAIWLSYGGDKMLQTNPGFDLMVQLRANQPNPVWSVMALDKRIEILYAVTLDANEGAITTVNPEG